MTKEERFEGCILGGAIGDAFGSGYEHLIEPDNETFYPFGKHEPEVPKWQITDDTILTLASCEAIVEDESLDPNTFANCFLKFFKQRKVVGIGSSTLKALQELDFGGHWSQVGRRGEFAAGNGAAMRIAPIAFCEDVSNSRIREICSITHNNDEAYVGALSLVIAIRSILNKSWTGEENLLEIIIGQIPDTRVRDRLISVNKMSDTADLHEIGKLGNDGYVVNAVPLAIAAASKVTELGLEKMYQQLIDLGGDTDTNCSIAGQIAGSLIGKNKIPQNLIDNLRNLQEYNWIVETIENLKRQKTGFSL